MIYRSIYRKLSTEKIANLICDKQRYFIAWDIESHLQRAPILLAEGWIGSHEKAISFLKANEDKVIQGFQGFVVCEESFLKRFKDVTAVDAKMVEIARQHTDRCPFCGRILEEQK